MNVATIKKIDNLLDYIPVVSAVSNLVNILAKIIFENYHQKPIQNSPYFVHLSQKSYLRCITLSIPILGIFIVSIYDNMNSASYQNPNEKVTTSKSLGEKTKLFPTSTRESKNESQSQSIPNADRGSRDIPLQSNTLINPIGIDNGTGDHPKSNCWCISVLQILCNTPLYAYIMSDASNLENKFPKIFEFIKTYREGKQSSSQLATKIKDIRLEISQSLGEDAFPSSEDIGADAGSFLVELLGKLSLDYKIIGIGGEEKNKDLNLSISKEKTVKYIFIDSSTISREKLNTDEIFDSTHYELIAALRVEPGHYSALFKTNNSNWRRCNNNQVNEVFKTFPSKTLKDDRGIFLIAKYKDI